MDKRYFDQLSKEVKKEVINNMRLRSSLLIKANNERIKKIVDDAGADRRVIKLLDACNATLAYNLMRPNYPKWVAKTLRQERRQFTPDGTLLTITHEQHVKRIKKYLKNKPLNKRSNRR